jgi:hypothetical protein
MSLHLATTAEANALLAENPLALLVGMLLDQHNVAHRTNKREAAR